MYNSLFITTFYINFHVPPLVVLDPRADTAPDLRVEIWLGRGRRFIKHSVATVKKWASNEKLVNDFNDRARLMAQF